MSISRRSTSRAFLQIALPALVWLTAVYSRNYLISPRCAIHPELCTKNLVGWFDSFAFRYQSGFADALSLYGEIVMAILAVIILSWVRRRHADGETIQRPTLRQELAALVSIAMWNGCTTEVIRLIVQRPRPFVYFDPVRLGANPAHYNSFYSGHTSFVSAMGVALLLLLLPKDLSKTAFFLISLLVVALIVSTGICRVLSGRHFPSDVVSAILGGTLVAAIAFVFSRTHYDLTMEKPV